MDAPLVTVICLCYNQEQYVAGAIRSVLDQTWPNIQLIVVDDASVDNSRKTIEEVARKHPEIKTLFLESNLGNCAAFNRGLALAGGRFIADLAADDEYMPERIEKQVGLFGSLPDDYGVVFTDALLTDETGGKQWGHKQSVFRRGLLDHIPEGDIFAEVIGKYFISSPSLLIRKEVFDELGGYDETLTYEDFDLIVRAARNWKFAWLDEQLTKVRKLPSGMSQNMYGPEDLKVASTFEVCRKIEKMTRNPEEEKALDDRLKYEWRQSVLNRNRKMAGEWRAMLKERGAFSWLYECVWVMFLIGVPIWVLKKKGLR